MSKTFFALGAIFGALAVAGGAFGAHALKNQLDADRFALFEMAARYQMYHALALLATAYAVERWPSASARSAGWLFVLGTLIFCGTLYALALGSPRWFGAITPVGGVCLIAAWMLLAWTAFFGDRGMPLIPLSPKKASAESIIIGQRNTNTPLLHSQNTCGRHYPNPIDTDDIVADIS